jgi:hypothetical protein
MKRLLVPVLGASILVALGAPQLQAEPVARTPSSKRVLAFAKSCEAQRVAPARDFERHLLDPKRARAAWTIVVSSPDAEARLAHAKEVAHAAQGTLERVTPEAVSKYIGETEKNLDRLFREAEAKNWILFFDEADALFGKRTEMKDSHDRYANQEVSYLLDALAKHRELVVIGVRSRDALDPPALEQFADRVVDARPRKSGPFPPAGWSEMCWRTR